MIHRQGNLIGCHGNRLNGVLGTLQVGDEIREINGVKVADNTIDTLQRMLVSL